MLLLCLPLASCQRGEEKETFSVPSKAEGDAGAVVDETGETKEIPWLTMVIDSPMIPSAFVGQFLRSVPGYGTEFQVEYELINPLFMSTEGDDGEPLEDPETRLRRMRTEMMAGKGPDIFLCDCASAALWENDGGEPFSEPLFNYPEKVMRSHVFLPLDEYISKAEYMEWDKLNQKVMEAGSYEGSQYILPIKYNLNLTCFDPELVSADLAREYGAFPTTEYKLNPAASYTDLLSYFGQPADYEHDVPSFTEDELLELALSGFDTAQKSREGYFGGLLNAPEGAFLSGGMGPYLFDKGNPGELPAYTMLPSYNRDGGATASITCFAAVNANTPNPNEAFRVLDYLMSEKVQQNDYIVNSVSGMPVYDELGSADKPISSSSRWWLNETNYDSFCSVREQISAVKFYSLLDREAMFSLSKTYLAEDATEDSVRKAAHSTYTTLKMMLAES